MTMEEYIAEIRLELTGNVLESELDDATLKVIVNKALREVQRYIDNTKIIVVPYASCIDLSESNLDAKVSSVSRVFRTEGLGTLTYETGEQLDPFYAQWLFNWSGGTNMYNLSNFISNYGSWMQLLQIRNTISTDLEFREDKLANKLYINTITPPDFIAIEYVPKFISVEEIVDDYWIDILSRLSIALAKLYVGRIRTRFTQSNALWQQDGEIILNEGKEEVEALRETLRINSQLTYPFD